jgi:hypothetical protein
MLDGHVDVAEHYCVRGWVADPADPARRVRLEVWVDGEVDGTLVAEAPRPDLARTGRHGDGAHGFTHFFARPLSLLRDWHIVVQEPETHDRCPGAEFILPARMPRRPADLVPLLVTSSGRAGSTLMMRRLLGHPAVVLGNQPPFELKLLTYYAKAFDVLTSPGNPQRSLAPDKIFDDPFTLGLNPYNHHDFEEILRPGAALFGFFSDTSGAVLAGAFREIIERFYRRVAAGAGQAAPAFFAEKTSIFDPIRAFARLLWPDLREVVLVRDPRDVVLSYRSFWRTDPGYARQMMRIMQDAIAAIRAAADPSVLILRYEDMITAGAATQARLSAFLGLATPLTLAPAAEAGLFTGHGTASSPEGSVGRWRRELTPEEIIAFTGEFSDMLTAFDYDH